MGSNLYSEKFDRQTSTFLKGPNYYTEYSEIITRINIKYTKNIYTTAQYYNIYIRKFQRMLHKLIYFDSN